jgi:AcrR family transcriptional regulator
MSSTADGKTARGRSTRTAILEAARATLLERGAGGTSTRSVADRAGVQLSLVHYHFGSKRDLLAAVLEHENDLLLRRQRELYATPGPLSQKWQTACALLDHDIASGYVRVLWELWAAGLADDTLADRWRAAMRGWRELLEMVAAAWAEEYQVTLPLTPHALATLITNIFQGVEIELLASVSEHEAPHREVLDAIGLLIQRAEAGHPR